MPDLTRNASDRDELEEIARQERQNERIDADVLRKVMMSPNGRSWLWRLLEWCDAHSDPFVPGVDGERETSRNLGRQIVGKHLMLQAMGASTDLYLVMMREAREKAEALRKAKAQSEQAAQEQSEGVETKAEDMVGDLTEPEPLKIDRSGIV